jgi:hypothetical protein
MENNWKINLKTKSETTISLDEISNILRTLKESGVERNVVREFLNYLRKYSVDDESEDRILEILDIVEGFCNEKYIVWKG